MKIAPYPEHMAKYYFPTLPLFNICNNTTLSIINFSKIHEHNLHACIPCKNEYMGKKDLHVLLNKYAQLRVWKN